MDALPRTDIYATFTHDAFTLINGLPQDMRKKMVGVGLLDAVPDTMTVVELIKKFLAEADVKPSKSDEYKQTTKSLMK